MRSRGNEFPPVKLPKIHSHLAVACCGFVAFVCSKNNSRARRTMWSSGATLLALLLVFVRPALGDACVLTGGSLYQLKSDAVDWTMRTDSGQSCIRGLRHNRVTIDTAKLISPPQSGQVKLLGSGFSYTAKSDFEGQDSFTIQVSGMLNGIRGSSDIRIIVSVGVKRKSINKSYRTERPSPR